MVSTTSVALSFQASRMRDHLANSIDDVEARRSVRPNVAETPGVQDRQSLRPRAPTHHLRVRIWLAHLNIIHKTALYSARRKIAASGPAPQKRQRPATKNTISVKFMGKHRCCA